MATEEKAGHAAHMKKSDERGLPGELPRPINLTFLGAGSMFCPVLSRDLVLIPGGARGEIRLVDVDADRLATMHKLVGKLVKDLGREDDWVVTSHTDRRAALPGTDYAVCCVEVSGPACVAMENDIPLKYGVDQCIGDTMGPGGLFKGLRTIPVFLDILRDMKELCPRALMLNYTNPMSMMCLAAGRAVPEISVVGLCHSVQGTSHQLAEKAGVPYEELAWECAGINHLAWFTRLEHRGENLYEKVLYRQFRELVDQAMAAETPDDELQDIVRADMCLNFGAYITESSGHLSEYLPYYRKSDSGRKLLRSGYCGESRFYASNWPTWRSDSDKHRLEIIEGTRDFDLERSWEYASWIIEACEKDVPYRIHGNVMNNDGSSGEAGKLITNLPGDGCVEVACVIDQNGVNPTRYGALPAQMAHICASNMAFFDLAATAVVEGSREAATHALMLDPLTQAVCTPGEIKSMSDEMFDAESEYLGHYA
ncbi:family 4 glycosyl hydrolase [Mucisphaera calidilacus]|uniref:Alpha-galactosidase n=1 Tax=Mucisphaera calidilacus TaxID=2527982 RepID=A0A518BWR2_9BACT|nr:alpha-glucosidase/alpha-galactosidase [Mucisphaera calidilacus]QDU71417.1 Alpha-galactosidase [Mucisphaera calidilacus]